MCSARYAVEDVDESVARQLLGTALTGRVGFVSRALPRMLPMHCAVHGDEVALASLHGREVGPRTGEVVVFEVDSYDATTREGWCVSVVGRCRRITETAEIAELDASDLALWRSDQGGSFFAVQIEVIHGRRLVRRPVGVAQPASR